MEWKTVCAHIASLMWTSSISITDVAARAETDCVEAEKVTQISACIDQAISSPQHCWQTIMADASTSESINTCDQDRDGLDDHFEDALARSYAPVFAFNHKRQAEANWPGNIEHFISNSLLLYSPTGLREAEPDAWSGRKLLRESLQATDLEQIQYELDEQIYDASNPDRDHGSNFWLCQRKAFDPQRYGGPLSAQETLSRADLSAAVPGGVGIYSIVHPSSWLPVPEQDSTVQAWPRYVLVAFELFFPYNEHPIDDHEGDWEGVGVFVDTKSPRGAVVGAYFQRHSSLEPQQLVMVDSTDPLIDLEHDPSLSINVGHGSSGQAVGLRFFDGMGPRHRLVVYIASGDHAAYHHPGETRLLNLPWPGDPSLLTDFHFGDGLKLLPWRSTYVDQWSSTLGLVVRDGVHIINLGEEHAPRQPWARFRGQWGCQNGLAGKLGASWPNPFGNKRHCRGWLRHNWGATIPFQSPASTPDCDGL